jgi:N-acetylglucosaminyldiphosphoundecaprenol N-acetyl-beta-D-mannosaminyltransferase
VLVLLLWAAVMVRTGRIGGLTEHSAPVSPGIDVTPTSRVLDVDFLAAELAECVEICERLASSQEPHLVVTANLAHAVLLADDADFRASYAAASVRVADGWPIVLLSKLKGNPLPSRVTGVDLAKRLVSRANEFGWRVVVVNGNPDTLALATGTLRTQFPNASFIPVHAPIGYQNCPVAGPAVALEIAAVDPQLVLLCTGAPQSEVWYHRNRNDHRSGLFLSCGGAIEVLAGTKQRAPLFVQKLGLEWLYRTAQEPMRLAPRYASGAKRAIPMAWRDLRSKR